MPTLVEQAAAHHKAGLALDGDAAKARAKRNRLVKRLRESDPKRWTYAELAAGVGCSPELVSQIIHRE